MVQTTVLAASDRLRHRFRMHGRRLRYRAESKWRRFPVKWSGRQRLRAWREQTQPIGILNFKHDSGTRQSLAFIPLHNIEPITHVDW